MKTRIPGILLCLAIAMIAYLIGQTAPIIGGPVTAIVIGAVLSQFVPISDKLYPGIRFSSKVILQAAIVLLGFGLNLSVIARTGWTSLPIIITTISLALFTTWMFIKLGWLDSDVATLIGVGSSICGGSAIAATAPVIEADDKQVALSISVIFFYNLIAALIFPTLGNWLGFSTTDGANFGLFAGTAINDTSSVTAAASAWDSLHQLGTQTLDAAVTVKLTRTLFIIPITLGLSFLRNKHDGQPTAWYRQVPRFLILFLAASLVTTLLGQFGIHLPGLDYLKTLSKFLIIVAMAAIGLNTNLKKLFQSGLRPLVLGFICWLIITVTSLSLQSVLGYW